MVFLKGLNPFHGNQVWKRSTWKIVFLLSSKITQILSFKMATKSTFSEYIKIHIVRITIVFLEIPYTRAKQVNLKEIGW